MNKYEVALVVSAKVEDEVRNATVEKVKDYIMNELGHGVTIFSVKGGYTKERQKMLMCVIPTREYYKLKEGISEIDKDSFFVITDSYEVKGGA